ncbi:phosphoethanolamine--lipid A transferase [Salinisphaera sp. T31B1]|uniref:phosphoethanolamine transferase n=1 Tax=Salinisphaera sp. T31B1 TaxID=727963 RepID=UPI003340E40D
MSDRRASTARFRPRIGVHAFTLLVALFIVAVDNREFWQQLDAAAHLTEISNWPFAIAVAVFLVAALSFLMSLFAWRYLYKPFVIGLLLIASVVAYFMTTYGVVIDDTMLANTVETDSAEAAGLFSLALVWHLLITGVLPVVIVLWVRLDYRPFWRALAWRLVFALIMLGVAGGAIGAQYKSFSLVLRQNRDLRMFINPTYAIYSASQFLTRSAEAENIPLKHIGQDATRTSAAGSRARRKILIVVVGETTRAANWGLNGYERDTTPELAVRGVLNFGDAHSCGTSTSVSVPCMFSPLTRKNYDEYEARHSENLLDVLARAGVAVHWQENQAGGCKGVCERVPTENMRARRIEGVCDADHCLDEVFLHGLSASLDDGKGDLVIVMHTMGSHGPAYYERYPKDFAVFGPECRSNRPADCSRAELVNSYDNTVRYVDHIVASLIDKLKTRADAADTALIYLSDHGESLGENGLYLHGFPYMVAPSEQTHIPMVAWLSPGFMRDSGLAPACLARATGERVSQDNLFDTVLGLMDVQATVYDPAEDLFANCRQAGANGQKPAD